jgi:hypothetical protein
MADQTYLQAASPTADLGGRVAGPLFLLVCPLCGNAAQTTGAPSDDGTTVGVPLEGDCGHRWVLNVRTRQGRTLLFATPLER